MADPTGIVGDPARYLRDTLAESARFQTLVGAGDATAAKAFIKFQTTPVVAPPIAVIGWGMTDWVIRARGTRNFFDQSGELWLLLRAPVTTSTEAGAEAEATAFQTLMGEIIKEVLELAGTGGFLDITDFQLGEPTRPPIHEGKSDADYIQSISRTRYPSHA